MRHAYPMLLDVNDRLIVIVGGGAVAARKAAGVIDAGARCLRVVAPEIVETMPQTVERVRERYESRHLEGAGLVFAATDSSDVNDAVVRDARARGVLVCRADADEALPGDFATPAKLKRGPVTVAVSAGGSAALAARIRDGVGERFDPRWAQLAEAMQVLRPMILERGQDPSRRTAALRMLASDEAMDVVAADGVDGLRRWIGERFPEFA